MGLHEFPHDSTTRNSVVQHISCMFGNWNFLLTMNKINVFIVNAHHYYISTISAHVFYPYVCWLNRKTESRQILYLTSITFALFPLTSYLIKLCKRQVKITYVRTMGPLARLYGGSLQASRGEPSLPLTKPIGVACCDKGQGTPNHVLHWDKGKSWESCGNQHCEQITLMKSESTSHKQH